MIQLFIGRIILSGVSFISFILVARWLEISEFGEYSLNLAVAGIINAIFFMYFRFALIRYGTEDKNIINKLATFNIIIILIIVFITFLLYILIDKWLVFLLLAVAIGTNEFIQELNRLKEKNNLILLNQLIRVSIFIIGIIYLKIGKIINYDNTTILLIISYIIPITINILIHMSQIKFVLDKNIIQEIYPYSLPLVINTLFIYFVDYSDRLIINSLLNVNYVGIYSGVYGITQQTIGVVFISLYIIFYRKFVKEYVDKDYKRFFLLDNGYKNIVICVVYFLLFWLINFGDFFTKKLLGFEYYLEPYLALIIGCGIILSCIKVNYFDIKLQLIKKTKVILYVSFFTAIFNLCLNLIFVPKYELYGASIATLIAFLFSAIVTYLYTLKLVEFQYARKEIKKNTILLAYFIVITLLIKIIDISILNKMLISFILSAPLIVIIITEINKSKIYGK